MTSVLRPVAFVVCLAGLAGCAETRPEYGVERQIIAPAVSGQVWAVAPAVNLSGEAGVDPLLQADILFAKLQSVRGVTAVPVNRVAEAYIALGISGIAGPEDAADVCRVLGVDALVLPSVTLYRPYDPPTIGVSVQVFAGPGLTLTGGTLADADVVRGLTRTASADAMEGALATPAASGRQMIQQVGVFDARDGSVRLAAEQYAAGRFDPEGPTRHRDVFLVMDRFSGFAYHALLADLMAALPSRAVASGDVVPASSQVTSDFGRHDVRVGHR